jgi:hypothetical protein
MSSSGVRYTKGRPPLRRGAGRGAFGKYLAIRDSSGQFHEAGGPPLARPIEIRIGGIYGVTNIIESTRRGVVNAFIDGIRGTLKEFMPHVAWDTGAMAGTLRQVVGAVLGGLVIRENYGTLQINWADIERSVTAALDYSQHHIIGHEQFNPAFAGGYKHPTTPGTRPIDPVEFMDLLQDKTHNALANSLNKEGLDAR